MQQHSCLCRPTFNYWQQFALKISVSVPDFRVSTVVSIHRTKLILISSVFIRQPKCPMIQKCLMKVKTLIRKPFSHLTNTTSWHFVKFTCKIGWFQGRLSEINLRTFWQIKSIYPSYATTVWRFHFFVCQTQNILIWTTYARKTIEILKLLPSRWFSH